MIYEYKCEKCHKQTDVITNNYDLKKACCKYCGADAYKIISSTADRNKTWAKECRNVI